MAVVSLPVFNGDGVDCAEAEVEILHIAARERLVVEGEGELELGVDGGEEEIFDSIGDALNGVGEDVAEIRGFRGMADAKVFGFTATEVPFGVGVVIDSAGLLKEELVAMEDATDGGDRDGPKALSFAEGIEKHFNFLLAKPGVFLAQIPNKLDDRVRNLGGA